MNLTASVLNPSNQTKLYQEKGYLIVEDLVSKESIEALRARMQGIAEGTVHFPKQDVELEPSTVAGQRRAVRKINRCAETIHFFWLMFQTSVFSISSNH